MNLSDQGIMLTETRFGENAGEIKAEPSMIDLDLVFGTLSVPPAPYESSFIGADGSSVNRVESDVSGADLLSAFNSISVSECVEPRDDLATDSMKADAFDSIGEDDLSGPRLDEGKDISEFVSFELASVVELSKQRDEEAEVLFEINETCEQSHPLFLYKSSRRRSVCNNESNLNHESLKRPRCRRIVNKGLDLSSLHILRRSRSSFSKRTRSSVWGDLGNILPDFKVSSGVDLNLGNEKELTRFRGGKGKRNAIRDQTGQKSIGKRCTPTGHISLKIKIGNKICGVVNATENFSASERGIPEIFDTVENKLGEKVPADMVSPHEMNSKNVVPSGSSPLSTNIDIRDACDTSRNFHQIISLEQGDSLRASIENHCSDVGTSPDSEVINPVSDAPICEKGSTDIQDGPIISNACVSPSDVPSLSFSQKRSKKGKKKDNLYRVGDCTSESRLTGVETTYNTGVHGSMGDFPRSSLPQSKSKKGKKKDKLCEVGKCSVDSKLAGAETTNFAEVPADLGVGERVGDTSYCSDALAKPYINCAEMDPCSGLVASIVSNSQVGDTLIPCSNGRKLPKCSRAKGGSKGRSRILDLPSRKDKASKKKGSKTSAGGKLQVSEKVGASGVLTRVESLLEAGTETQSDLGETVVTVKDLSGSMNSLQLASGEPREQCIPSRNAWVLCDECQKWRRIPATLADQIEETNRGWTCKDNMEKDFADCSIPQEKSNSQINEELEISDVEENACDSFLNSNQNQSKAVQQASWSLIKSNLFLHRSRKTQTIDEVMVCHCKPPSDGRMGCGAKCLNRMLNIECVRGTCPCGELCSNQQFQKRKYAKLKWFRCGKKGYGLQALEDIFQGQFLIEYVGEVLDVHAYEARQRDYALNGHKHFYFMTLNGSEVIDACAKGNLGRFINHGCDPNCRTEKWMVNGEVCIGLFALRDIKKGEEVTFDYNYVRVFGAAAKTCMCGSPNCQGYIGGDPTNSEVIVQVDSDDEFSEPVMICEDKEMKEDWSDIISNSLNGIENEISNEPPEKRYSMKKLISAVGGSITELHTSETSTQKVEGVNSAQVVETLLRDKIEVDNYVGNDSAAEGQITGESQEGSITRTFMVESEGLQSQKHSSSQLMNLSLQSDDILDKAMHSADKLAITMASPSKSLSDIFESKRKLKYATVGESNELSKSNSLAKTKRSSSSIKKGKLRPDVNDKTTPDADKSNAALHRLKKLPEISLNNHFEAVEGKLNDLLDAEGGISKRKDASRGYLKLLFLTAASGNSGHGESIRSNRDLSMILDALLKTKSRSVLVDIINKNGLQMLHNIMKRYRKEFIKTPILRKLLKVLEYLAMREILTLDHITGGPPCPGVESFKDSILILTEHADRQVHQIARNFRDRWIPRSLRRNCCMERDGFSATYDYWSDKVGKPSEAINSCKAQSVAASSAVETPGLDLLSASGITSGTNGTRTRKRKSRWDNPLEEYPHSRTRTTSAGDENLDTDEDAPPGFPAPCNGPMIPSDASTAAINHQEGDMCVKQNQLDIVLGDSLPRFLACMPVSYGVSYSVMQQIGARNEKKPEDWTIAPGVPFHPFPPLPPCARGMEAPPTSAARCAPLCEPVEKAVQHCDTCVPCHGAPPDKNFSVANSRPVFQQGGSYSLGRNYFRQQKWNHSKLGPPWARTRNGWGYAGNNTRNGSPV